MQTSELLASMKQSERWWWWDKDDKSMYDQSLYQQRNESTILVLLSMNIETENYLFRNVLFLKQFDQKNIFTSGIN